MIKGLNHVGMCVKSIDETFAMMEKTMGATMISRVEYPQLQQITALVALPDGNRFELMEPTGDEGTVGKFIQKKGEGLHHISLKTDSVDETCDEFEAAGCRLLSKGDGIAFVHPKSAFGVLVEISDGTYGQKK